MCMMGELDKLITFLTSTALPVLKDAGHGNSVNLQEW